MTEGFGADPAESDLCRHGKWTKEEDDLLRFAIHSIGEGKWRHISTHVPGRSALQCLQRWTRVLRPGRTRGLWTALEDEQLRQWVHTQGPAKWSLCAVTVVGRTGKQCRERWINALSPQVKRGEWDEAEDQVLLREFERVGPKWSEIAKVLPGRSDNAIKNRFYANVRKLRPKCFFPPFEGNTFYYDDSTDLTRIEAEMQVFNLLRYMQKLESMLCSTREQINGLETSIDLEAGRVAALS